MRRLLVVGVGMLAAACGGESGTNPGGGTDTRPAQVVVSPADGTLVSIGDTLSLAAAVKNSSGQAVSASVTWSSGSPEVATVNSVGRVLAVGNGVASITATAGTVSGNAAITVRQAVAESEVSGGNQAADAATPLDSTVVVTLLDALGNAIPGAPVTFGTPTGGGSLADADTETDAAGQAGFTWTLGPMAGVQEVEMTAGFDDEATLLLAATAWALTPDSLAYLAGDAQTELAGLELPGPVEVQLLDSLGNGVPDAPVTFTISGDGAVPDTVFTDTEGIAAAPVTLGSTLGPYDVTARAIIFTDTLGSTLELPGSPMALTATAVAWQVVSPGSAQVGDTLSITGTGFHPVPDSNFVTLAGLELAVLGGTQSTLQVEVPDFGCVPQQVRAAVVSRTGSSSEVPVDVLPRDQLGMAVGDRVLLDDPSGFCLQFPGGSNSQYIVGLTATAWFDASSTFRLTGVDSASSPLPASPGAVEQASGDGLTVRETPVRSDTRVQVGGSPELAVRTWEETLLSSRAAATALDPSLAGFVDVDEVVSLRVPNMTLDPCNDYSALDLTVVWAEGGAAIALPQSFIDQYQSDPEWIFLFDSIQAMTQAISTAEQAQLQAVLGLTEDWAADPQVLLAVTPAAGPSGIPGFDAYASVVDRIPRATCPSSDERKVVYVTMPDAADIGSLVSALPAARPDVAHQMTHLLQWDRRLEAGIDLLPAWLAEGQAEAMVERIGLFYFGAWDIPNRDTDILTGTDLGPWINPRFDRLSLYQGEDPDVDGARLPGAPEGCSLYGYQGVCGSESFPGAAWSFVRYLTDRFGDVFPGGREGIMRAIVALNPTEDERAQLSAQLGVTFEEVMSDWAAMLYVDDRLLSPTAQNQQMTSWRLPGWLRVPGRVRYAPPQYGFQAFQRTGSVVGGGTAYTLVTTTTSHRPLALRVTNDNGRDIASLMRPRLWVVRMR